MTEPFALSVPVAHNGIVSTAYPVGYVQANFTGALALADGVVAVNDNEVYMEALNHVAIAYGASVVSITNKTGVVWPAGARLRAQFAFKTFQPSPVPNPNPNPNPNPTPTPGTVDYVGDFNAIIAAGGTVLDDMVDAIGFMADRGGEPVEPAELADLLVDTPGFLIVTPEVLAEVITQVVLTPSAGNLPIDGATFETAFATITAATAFNIVTGITDQTLKVYLLASGGSRVVTSPGTDHTSNFGAGVTIPSGKIGRFLFDLIDGETCCTFGGYTD